MGYLAQIVPDNSQLSNSMAVLTQHLQIILYEPNVKFLLSLLNQQILYLGKVLQVLGAQSADRIHQPFLEKKKLYIIFCCLIMRSGLVVCLPVSCTYACVVVNLRSAFTVLSLVKQGDGLVKPL